MPNEYELWEDEADDDQSENRGQSKLPEPRKGWKFGKFENNEVGNANP